MRRSLLLVLGILVGCQAANKSTSTPVASAPAGAYQGHGAESVSPDEVKRFAPPALDPKVASSVQALLDITTPNSGQPTPDGKRLFFEWSVSGVTHVWRLDNPMGFPVQMTGGPDRTSFYTTSPDGKFLVLSRDHAGEENPGIYLQSVDGGALKKVKHLPKVRTSLGWITNDSKFLYYWANDIKPDSNAFYRYDISADKSELVFDQPGIWSVADVWGDSRFLFRKAKGAIQAEFYTWSSTTRELQPVLGQNEFQQYDMSFSADAQFLVRTEKFDEFHRLYLFNPKAEGATQWKAITPKRNVELENFWIDHSRQRIYLKWNEDGFNKTDSLDARTLKPAEIPKFPDAEQLHVMRVTRFGRFVTFAVDKSRDPRQFYVWDRKLNKTTKWAVPSAPETDLAAFAKAQASFFPARDGTKIPLLVYEPKTCAQDPCPVVAHFHGGPEGQSRPGFNRLAQIFVRAGFVYVEPNVRGSTGYGKTWLAADDGPKRLNVITDIEDCSKYLREKYTSNGKIPKVGVMGWSYGGYSTLMAMTRFAGAYDAGVGLVGMSNLVSFLKNTAPYRRMLRVSEYGDPEKDLQALQQLSPITYIDQIRDPLMIVQGVSDPRVPVGEAMQIYQKTQEKKLATRLILFADEGHGTQKKDNRVLEIGHTLQFFKDRLLKN